MVKLNKTHRDLLLLDFVQSVSAPETSAKRRRKWHSLQKNCPDNFTEEEWMRLWRGVYYIVWYEEMRKGGEEFIIHIAEWENPGFLLSAFKAMADFWGGIDAFRIDKYMFLARHILNRVFRLIHTKGNAYFESHSLFQTYRKEQDSSLSFNKVIEDAQCWVVDFVCSESAKAVGLFMHICDIWIDELDKVVKDVSERCTFMVSFLKRLALVGDERIRKHITNLLDQFITSTVRENPKLSLESLLSKFPDIAISIGSSIQNGKNRNVLYSLAQKTKGKLEDAKRATKGEITLKRKIVGFKKVHPKRKVIRYQTTTSFMYPRSTKPLPLEE